MTSVNILSNDILSRSSFIAYAIIFKQFSSEYKKTFLNLNLLNSERVVGVKLQNKVERVYTVKGC